MADDRAEAEPNAAFMSLKGSRDTLQQRQKANEQEIRDLEESLTNLRSVDVTLRRRIDEIDEALAALAHLNAQQSAEAPL